MASTQPSYQAAQSMSATTPATIDTPMTTDASTFDELRPADAQDSTFDQLTPVDAQDSLQY